METNEELSHGTYGFSVLRVDYASPGLYRLVWPFVFVSESGVRYEVPAGFITDFDSVPALPLVYWLLKGHTNYAAVVHDYLYESKAVSRREADRIFLEAMKVEKVPWYRRIPIYVGVRIGGWWGYQR
jgi:hypothetical protein